MPSPFSACRVLEERRRGDQSFRMMLVIDSHQHALSGAHSRIPVTSTGGVMISSLEPTACTAM